MSDAYQINASLQIQKSAEIIFDAIVNPEKMKNYFISESNSVMLKGTVIEWKFPEFEERFQIEVIDIRSPEFISFTWEENNHTFTVEIIIKTYDENSCVVEVTESNIDSMKEGIERLRRNTSGWANFLCCLKAYLEYNINLRKGSFDYYIKQAPAK